MINVYYSIDMSTRHPCSEESRMKMRLAKLGKKQSPETIKKRMVWRTVETIKRMGN